MNQRIKELSDIAYKNHLKNNPESSFGRRTDYDKEFAELIVRECILTIQMGITRDGHNTEKYLRSMKHLKDIKEHFGVEE